MNKWVNKPTCLAGILSRKRRQCNKIHWEYIYIVANMLLHVYVSVYVAACHKSINVNNKYNNNTQTPLAAFCMNTCVHTPIKIHMQTYITHTYTHYCAYQQLTMLFHCIAIKTTRINFNYPFEVNNWSGNSGACEGVATQVVATRLCKYVFATCLHRYICCYAIIIEKHARFSSS